MRRWSCIFLLTSAILYTRIGVAVPSLEYRPEWRVGQEWVIEVSNVPGGLDTGLPEELLKPRNITTGRYRFKVEHVEEFKNEPCWYVSIRYMKSDGTLSTRSHYQAFFHQEEYWLRRLAEFDGDNTEPRWSLGFYRGAVSGGGLLSVQYLQFPFFTSVAEDLVPTKVEWKNRRPGIPADQAYQICRNITGVSAAEDSLYIELRSLERRAPRLRSTQIWQKGLPWWSEAVFHYQTRYWCVGRLFSVDGVELPAPDPRVWTPVVVHGDLGVETNAAFQVIEGPNTDQVPAAAVSSE